MKSKAQVFGHPLHPMLISLPITCVIGALLSDIIARSGGYRGWNFMGYVLTIGAWATGLLAAIPGLIDYFFVIPRQTAAKRDATLHMALNVAVVLLFFVSWVIKATTGAPYFPRLSSIFLEVIGTIGLVGSGWLGGALAYQHRIGVLDSSDAALDRAQRADSRDRNRWIA